MKIAIGSDHRGFYAKHRLIELLELSGHELIDFGTKSNNSCDYPESAFPTAISVRDGKADKGILLCGSGIGMSIAANKVHGIRAALCHDELTAEMSRRHNDANVLCLPADLVGEELIKRIVEIWVETEFEGGRHERRINKVMEFENKKDC